MSLLRTISKKGRKLLDQVVGGMATYEGGKGGTKRPTLQSESRMRQIADNLPVLIAYVDNAQCYRFCNRHYENIFGAGVGELTGRHVKDVLDASSYAVSADKIDAVLRGEKVCFERAWRDGATLRHWRVDYVPDLTVDGRVPGFYVMVQDVTELKLVESRLRDLARHDSLTGLANRHHFNERFSDAINRSQRSRLPVALMFLDIDSFKLINDTLGHHGGDEVLREFARRLLASVRQTDMVARLAGDEFVIVLENLESPDEAGVVAAKILSCMEQDFVLAGGSHKVGVSIGITLRRDGETDADALLRRADEALYVAKSAGRCTYRLLY